MYRLPTLCTVPSLIASCSWSWFFLLAPKCYRLLEDARLIQSGIAVLIFMLHLCLYINDIQSFSHKSHGDKLLSSQLLSCFTLYLLKTGSDAVATILNDLAPPTTV